MKYQTPKGTRDFYGENFAFRKLISEKILTVLKNYGFQQVQTPIIESLELLQAMAGEEVAGQIYTLTDKGGRKLGLRSDITPPLTRLFVNTATALQKPIKFCCFDRVYRYERPQEGRYREIYQINGEAFGAPAPLADAEILQCMYDCYKEIGLPDVKVVIGYRPLLESFVANFGITKSQQEEIIKTLDKKNKISQEDFAQSLYVNGIQKNKLFMFEKFLNLRGESKDVLPKAKKFFAKNKTALMYVEELKRITDRLKFFGLDKKCITQLSLARGSEYYTGIIFEFITPKAPFSIGGGGRYDKLVPVFGGNSTTPAVGFSIGFDRVIDVLRKENKQIKTDLSPDVFIIFDTKDQTSEEKAIKLATNLRNKGNTVELNLLIKTVSEQIELAKKRKAKKTIIFRKEVL